MVQMESMTEHREEGRDTYDLCIDELLSHKSELPTRTLSFGEIFGEIPGLGAWRESVHRPGGHLCNRSTQ